MTTIRERLKLRYGLPMTPSSDDIANWQEEIHVLIAGGKDIRKAAESAASQVFAGYEANPRMDDVDLFSVLPAETRALLLSAKARSHARAAA